MEFADLSGSQFAWTRPYAIAAVKPYRTGLEFHDFGLRKEHATRIAALVNAEGPVHLTYLTTRLSRAFGLHRAGARIVDAVQWGVRSAVTSGSVVVRGPFVWPATSRQFVFVRVPREGDPDTIRPIEQIPPEEIDLCLLRHLGDAGSLEESRLRSNVARILGFDRTGGHIGEAIDSALISRKREGVVQELANGCLTLNPRHQLPPLPEVAAAQDSPALGAALAPPESAPRPASRSIPSAPSSRVAAPAPIPRAVAPTTIPRAAAPAPIPQTVGPNAPYGPGDTVSHPRLGIGVVRSVQGPMVEVAFAGMTRTTIDTRIIPMTKVSSGRGS